MKKSIAHPMKYHLLLLGIPLAMFCGCSTPEQHEANEQRHAVEERQREEDNLRRKFAKYSTAELQLMHSRYTDLAKSPSGRDVNITIDPLARALFGDSDTANAQRVIEIERELLRRYQNGDQEAHLPSFDK